MHHEAGEADALSPFALDNGLAEDRLRGADQLPFFAEAIAA
jgi:hypothetical protein